MRKAILMSTAIFALLVTPVFAHCGKCGMEGKHAEKKGGCAVCKTGDMCPVCKTNKLKDKLGLSDEQAAQVQALIEEKIAKKDAAAEEFKTKLKGVLTAEQLEKYESMKSGHGHMDKDKDGKMGKGDSHNHKEGMKDK